MAHSAKKPAAKTPVIVASHTHWDRAWYFPFQQFRHLLVEMVDHLLDTLAKRPDFKVFNLDGQSVVLEDYLAVRPENRELLAEHIRNGRITVGPWYVLPDEFLVSGEALIRNLAIGQAVAREFGKSMDAGYIPDPFGHISQLPQILRGCGLDSCIFSRGLPREWANLGSAFKWFSPDGKSWVLGLLQVDGYGNMCELSHHRDAWQFWPAGWDHISAKTSRLLEKMEAVGHPGALLFNNGMDHFQAEPLLGDALARLNKESDKYRFIHGSFADYVALVRKAAGTLSSATGEMHSGAFGLILSGVFSTRMPLKQANAAAEAHLERLAEPLAAAAFLAGDAYPEHHLLHAWKKLLKNHPHDDICGCSVDAVHEDMATRFRNVNEASDFVCNRALGWLGHTAQRPAALAGPRNIAFNGLGRPRTTILRGEFRLPDGTPRKVVLDDAGKPLPTSPGAVRSEVRHVWDGELKKAVDRTFHWQAMAWQAQLPACGYAQFGLGETKAPPPASVLKAADQTIENEYLRIIMDRSGSVTIVDKATGYKLAGGNVFEDQADMGDEYDFSPLAGDTAIRSATTRGRVKARLLGSAGAEVTCELVMKVPPSLSDHRRIRSRQRVDLPIRTTARLTPGATRVEFITVVNNTASDHRLRVVFPTHLRSETVEVAQHFDILSRPVTIPPGDQRDAQQPVQTQHCDEFVAVSEKGRSVALFNRGLPEYQARQERGRVTLVQTLLRCCGWLSRADLTSRPGHAGPFLPTPAAQCLGKHTFHYAVALRDSSAEQACLWQDAADYTTPCYVIGLDERENGQAPARASLLQVDEPRVAVSAIKAGPHGLLVVRLWNATARPVTPTIAAGFEVASASLADMLEQPGKKLPVSDGKILLPALAPREIVTILLTPAHRGPSAPIVHVVPHDIDGHRCL